MQHLLREAAFDGEMEDVLTILALDYVDVNGKDAHGDTALLESGGGGQVKMIELLVERGAIVNAQGKFQRTPLFRAAFGGHHAAVLRLLQLGCDAAEQTCGVPHHCAAQHRNCRWLCCASHPRSLVSRQVDS